MRVELEGQVFMNVLVTDDQLVQHQQLVLKAVQVRQYLFLDVPLKHVLAENVANGDLVVIRDCLTPARHYPLYPGGFRPRPAGSGQ